MDRIVITGSNLIPTFSKGEGHQGTTLDFRKPFVYWGDSKSGEWTVRSWGLKLEEVKVGIVNSEWVGYIIRTQMNKKYTDEKTNSVIAGYFLPILCRM